MAPTQDLVLKVSGTETAMLCYLLHGHHPMWAVSWELGALALAAALTPTSEHSLLCPGISLEVVSCAHWDSPVAMAPPRLLLQDRKHVIAVGGDKVLPAQKGEWTLSAQIGLPSGQLQLLSVAVQSCLQQQQNSFYSNFETSVLTSRWYIVSAIKGRLPQAPLQPWVPPSCLMGPKRLTLPRGPLLLCQGGYSRTGGCTSTSQIACQSYFQPLKLSKDADK